MTKTIYDVFISYCGADRENAERIEQHLVSANLSVWRDKTRLKAGDRFSDEIKTNLSNSKVVLCLLTEGYFNSTWCSQETGMAEAYGAVLFPLRLSSDMTYAQIRGILGERHIPTLGDDVADLDDLVSQLREAVGRSKVGRPLRAPFMVDDLPEDFVPRPGEFDQLVTLLLDQQHEEPVAITAALRGAGGYGKTTLAKAIGHDPRVREEFKDGILWVTLGENPGDLTEYVGTLIHALDPEQPSFNRLPLALDQLRKLIAGLHLLIVIDDVWNRVHLEPFLQGGPRCARLITTRNFDTLPSNALQVNVDAMQPGEAIHLLGAGLSPSGEQPARQRDVEGVDRELQALAKRLGNWALLLDLVKSTLRNRITAFGQPLLEAIAYVNKALDNRGLTFFDEHNAQARHRAVALTLGVSFDQLRDHELRRFRDLAVFPEDVNIPFETLERYWGLDDLDTEALCEQYARLSLLFNFDPSNHTIRLHDVIRKHLNDEQRDRLAELHQRLLDNHRPPPVPHDPSSLRPPVVRWAEMPETEPYLWDHLAYHLLAAGRSGELAATVKDWRYLAKKTFLRKSHAVEMDLTEAEQMAPADDLLRTLRRSFVNSGHLFNHCETREDVKETVFARLQHLRELKPMLREMAESLKAPHVEPQFALPDLPHPALIRTLEGHSSGVSGCAFSPDGKLVVSASYDNTLKLWDAATGELRRTLEGHSSWVSGCAFSPDGKLVVSASYDNTLKLWDAATGELRRTLEGHSSGVRGCAFSPDGKLVVSASYDNTLKLWDAATGELRRTLEGHSSGVSGCAFSPDGKLVVSASYDNTLKLWDAATGELRRTLEGHSDGVSGCAFSPDGKLVVSASYDNTLKLWDAATGELRRTLEGHSSGVRGCAFSPDGKLVVSASYDNTLKLWDAATGELRRTLEGHSSGVIGCAFSPDGKLVVSASYDKTLKLWDAATGELRRTLEGHSSLVSGCAFSPDGKLVVSASYDNTLKLWDAATGELRRTLEGHSDGVRGCAFSPDGKLVVSASWDNTLKLWDAATGELRRTLEGHSSWVSGCAFSPDGKVVVSASWDNTLKLWDAATGELRRTLEGHSDGVSGCAFSPDGKLVVSASDDNTLKLWDAATGELRRTLEGHSYGVIGCAFSPDGKLVVSASDDNTLKLWDAATGELRRTLEGHSYGVSGCAFSPDGKLVVSASYDKTLKLWDAATGKCLAAFYADGPLYCVAISGDLIVAGGARGVYFLRLAP